MATNGRRLAAMTILFVLLGTGVAQAALQNGPLQNGDFNGSNRLHWQSYVTTGGSAPTLGFGGTAPFNTTGNVESPAALFQVSNAVGDGQQRGGGIYQDVTLTPGHWKLAADIASDTPDMGGGSWADCGQYTLSIGGTALASREFTDCASGTTQRAHLEGTLSVATAGSYTVRIEMTRTSLFSVFNPYQYVDNVTLEPYTPPPPNLVRPVLSASSGFAAATEGEAAVAVDPSLGVSDSDSFDLTGATARISSGLHSGDVLDYTPPDGSPISVVHDAGNPGVVTLTGTASVPEYRDALRAVTFWTSNDNPGTSRTVQFTVNDGVGDSNTASRAVTVTPVNDAPLLLTDTFGTAYAWGDPPMQVGPVTEVSDPDSAVLTSATAEIFFGYEAGDRLEFTSPAGVTGNYNATTHTVTFTGPASAATFQTALRSVRFASSSPNPSFPLRGIGLSISDGDRTAVAGIQFSVVQVNQPPVVSPSAGSLNWSEGEGAAAIDPDLFVTDADDPVLTGATVKIAAGFASGDVLEYAEVYGIAGDYDSSTGVLTLSGRATKFLYQAALRTVAFGSASDDPGTSRTISFAGTNGGPSGTAAIRTVAVTPVNDAPVVTAGAGSLAYAAGDAAKVVDDALTVTDVDNANLAGAVVRLSGGFEPGDVLSYTAIHGIVGTYDPDTGVLTLTGTASTADYQDALRSVRYAATEASPAAVKAVTFTAGDGQSESAVALRSVAVTAPPTTDPPTDDPPADTPPEDTPPSDTPPSDAPAGDTPPKDTPPASSQTGPGAPGTPAAPEQTAGDTTPPVLRSLTTRAPKLKAFLATGLPFTITSSEPGQLSAVLLLDRATAKRNGMRVGAGKTVTVGELKATRFAGTAKSTFKIKLTKTAARSLKKARRLNLTLRVTATDAAGNPSAPMSLTVRLKR